MDTEKSFQVIQCKDCILKRLRPNVNQFSCPRQALASMQADPKRGSIEDLAKKAGFEVRITSDKTVGGKKFVDYEFLCLGPTS